MVVAQLQLLQQSARLCPAGDATQVSRGHAEDSDVRAGHTPLPSTYGDRIDAPFILRHTALALAPSLNVEVS